MPRLATSFCRPASWETSSMAKSEFVEARTSGFREGQRVRMLVETMGEDHNGIEHGRRETGAHGSEL